MTRKAIAIVSGGLDSTTMVYHLLNEGYEVDCLSFDYGQRHKKELVFARAMAIQLGLKFDVVDLTGLTHLISNSALTSHMNDIVTHDKTGQMYVTEVPEGHYAEENMKLTVVPNRNMIMLSIATGVAVNRKANAIATGVHAGDHFIYPDCRTPFLEAMNIAVHLGNEGFHNFDMIAMGPEPDDGVAPCAIYAPFASRTKADIAYRALELGVPLHMTWSCYKGGENHCGRCGTCVERLEAIDEATRRWESIPDDVGDQRVIFDMTEYDDDEFWKVAVQAGVK